MQGLSIIVNKEETLKFLKNDKGKNMGIYKLTKGKKVILSLYEKQLKRIKGKYEDIY